MTDQQHPITPPLELLQQWAFEYWGPQEPVGEGETYIATQAARWGADQQLEQDAKWLDTNALFSHNLTISPSGDALRQKMRPKPPSLKELNLKHLEVMERDGHYLPEIIADLRRALESLPD